MVVEGEMVMVRLWEGHGNVYGGDGDERMMQVLRGKGKV